MPSTSPNFQKNQLLAVLSNSDLALPQRHLEPVPLEVGQVLEAPNKPIKHCYFIERGLASIVALNGHQRLEVGLIGPEGMTGLAIVLGNDRSPHENFIQVAGKGWRILCPNIARGDHEQGARLRRALGFAAFLHEPDRQTPLSQMARPPLRSDWRAGSSWPMTVWTVTRYRSPTSSLSLILGVRRAGVTIALHSLRAKGRRPAVARPDRRTGP